MARPGCQGGWLWCAWRADEAAKSTVQSRTGDCGVWWDAESEQCTVLCAMDEDGLPRSGHDEDVRVGGSTALPPPTPVKRLRPPRGLERFVLMDTEARLIRVQLPHASVLLDAVTRSALSAYLYRCEAFRTATLGAISAARRGALSHGAG